MMSPVPPRPAALLPGSAAEATPGWSGPLGQVRAIDGPTVPPESQRPPCLPLNTKVPFSEQGRLLRRRGSPGDRPVWGETQQDACKPVGFSLRSGWLLLTLALPPHRWGSCKQKGPSEPCACPRLSLESKSKMGRPRAARAWVSHHLRQEASVRPWPAWRGAVTQPQPRFVLQPQAGAWGPRRWSVMGLGRCEPALCGHLRGVSLLLSVQAGRVCVQQTSLSLGGDLGDPQTVLEAPGPGCARVTGRSGLVPAGGRGLGSRMRLNTVPAQLTLCPHSPAPPTPPPGPTSRPCPLHPSSRGHRVGVMLGCRILSGVMSVTWTRKQW